MSEHTQEGLLSHSGHTLSIYFYGKRENPESVTIECDKCNEILLSIDNDDELESSKIINDNYDENRGEGTDELK